ncbi:MAG TPA: 30S ribosomal protein S20 [Elusimicrobiota bacterium]|nr:30S ribosomal protein S20 [Elusimicrobiota bacterium]
MAKLKTGRHTSALKVARQAVKHRWRNATAKDGAKELTKELLAAVSKKDAAKAKELLPQVMSVWSRIGRRNVVHHAMASRKIARLSKAVLRISAK